jgi:hypothetical protein
MFKIKKFLDSRTGIILVSILLGLGLSTLLKMSCDNRSCIVYQAPTFDKKKIIRYNKKCYEPKAQVETCSKEKTIVDV